MSNLPVYKELSYLSTISQAFLVLFLVKVQSIIAANMFKQFYPFHATDLGDIRKADVFWRFQGVYIERDQWLGMG